MSWLDFRRGKEFQAREKSETMAGLYKEVKLAEKAVENVISHWVTEEKWAEIRAKQYKREPFPEWCNIIWPDFDLQLSQLEEAISELRYLKRLLDEARSSEVSG